MQRPLLYSGTKNASSWGMRAWLALREAGVDFDEVVVDIRRPQRFTNLTDIGRISPPAAVPVLVVDDKAIFDSLAIMEFANELGGGQLLPAERLERAAARSVLAWQHSGLSNIATKISFESSFYPERRSLTATEIEECSRLQVHLETLLMASGGPFLFGSLTLADLALAPTVVRLTAHQLAFPHWPLTAEWFETLLKLPSVEEWMADARLLPHIWFDDYVPDADPRRPAETNIPSAATSYGLGWHSCSSNSSDRPPNSRLVLVREGNGE